MCRLCLSNDFLNQYLCEQLAMAVFAAIALAALFLEDDDMFTLEHGGQYLAYYLCTVNCGCAYFYVTVGINEQHVAEFYCIALLGVAEVLNIQILACFGLELLSFDFYNCVHFYRLSP